jgi:hypothetical protein
LVFIGLNSVGKREFQNASFAHIILITAAALGPSALGGFKMITLLVLALGAALYGWFHHHGAKANKS